MERYENIRNMFGLGSRDHLLQNFIGGAVAPETTTLVEAYEEQQAVIRQMVAEMPANQPPQMDFDEGTEESPVVIMRHSLTDTKLKDHLAAKLPSYMVPGIWFYLPKLPLTANGKVDRKALPLPETRTAKPEGGGKPGDELEQTIVDLVASILAMEDVGTRDNFFELGANSLQLVQLQGRLQEQLQLTIPITTIFANPTVVALAGNLRGQKKDDALQEGRDRARLRRKKSRGSARKRKERK